MVTLQSNYASLQDAVERIEVQEEFLKAAQLRAEVARTKYTTGLLSFDEWDLIENDLISTQKSHLQALLKYNNSRDYAQAILKLARQASAENDASKREPTATHR